jgi:hypothetical protein
MPMTQRPELDLPAAWAPLVMPRKGGHVQPGRPSVDPEAAERIDRLVTEHFALVESFFPPIFTDVVLRDATARHLSTGPDPTGAAVLHLILGSLVAEEHRLGPFLDAWIAKHGVAFAAAAALERCTITSGYLPIGDTRRVTVDETQGLKWAADCDRDDLRRLRAAIATADDYEAVVEALDARRNSPWRNTIAAFLAPTEKAWVNEAMEAAFPDQFSVEWMHWHAVSTDDHLTTLEEQRASLPSRTDTGMLATLLDGCGSAALPVLAGAVPPFGWKPAQRPDLATVLTSAESPEALRRLLARLDVKGAIPLAGAVVRRFPAMAVRAVADQVSATGANPELATLLPSDPLVWRAIAPDLPASYLDATASLREIGPDTPVASGAELPSLLTEPPWRQRDQGPEPRPALATAPPVDLELRWREREEPNPMYDDPAAMLDEIAAQPSRGELLLPLAGLRPARVAAAWFAGKPQAHNVGRNWLERHGPAAAPWLAFDALGEPGPHREQAAAALRYLAHRHGREAIAADLPEPTAAARSALDAILGAEALYALPRTLPRIPDWADPSLLPPIWTRDGEKVLPALAVEHLLLMLLLSASDVPYAGLEDALAACDRTSLERFSKAITDQWERVGREKSGAKGWVPRQVELIGAGGG